MKRSNRYTHTYTDEFSRQRGSRGCSIVVVIAVNYIYYYYYYFKIFYIIIFYYDTTVITIGCVHVSCANGKQSRPSEFNGLNSLFHIHCTLYIFPPTFARPSLPLSHTLSLSFFRSRSLSNRKKTEPFGKILPPP